MEELVLAKLSQNGVVIAPITTEESVLVHDSNGDVKTLEEVLIKTAKSDPSLKVFIKDNSIIIEHNHKIKPSEYPSLCKLSYDEHGHIKEAQEVALNLDFLEENNVIKINYNDV